MVLIHSHHDEIDATPLLHQLTKNKQIQLTNFSLGYYLFDAKVMAKFLLQSNRSLCMLILSSPPRKLQKYPVINEVIKILPNLKVLQRLTLSGFQIAGCVKYLRPIISQLHELHLSACPLQEKHLKELFSFLNRGKKLKILGLSSTPFSLSAFVSFVECLKELPVLEELRLMNTGMSDQTACILAEGLRENSTLRILDLSWNLFIGPIGMAALNGLPCFC